MPSPRNYSIVAISINKQDWLINTLAVNKLPRLKGKENNLGLSLFYLQQWLSL